MRRESHAAHEQAEALLALASEYGFLMLQRNGTFMHGRALILQGQIQDGIAHMLKDERMAMETTLFGSHHLVQLAEACGRVGQPDKELCLLAEAQTLIDRHDTRLLEAEIYRLKGELLLSAECGVRN